MIESLPSTELRLLLCLSEHDASLCSLVHMFMLMAVVICICCCFRVKEDG